MLKKSVRNIVKVYSNLGLNVTYQILAQKRWRAERPGRKRNQNHGQDQYQNHPENY